MLRLRSILGALLAISLVGACAPTRADSPPRPELVSGQRSEPASLLDLVAASESTTVAEGWSGDTGEMPADGSAGIQHARDAMFAAADGSAAPGWSAFDESLRLALIPKGSPTASVAVAVDGEVIHTAAFGERIPGTDEPADPDDRFRIASISKVITAVVLLQLVEEGLVGLNEPVGERLARSLGVEPTDPKLAEVTPQHLLSHTSGLVRYESMFFGDGVEPCLGAARYVMGRTISAPGGYRYSNMNYCLAGLLIEDLTGRSYEDVVRQRLLEPLGIEGMRLAGTYEVGLGEVAHFSRPGRNYMEALAAAGAWVASASDVARIIGSLDPSNPGWHPLGDDLLQRMRRPPFDRPRSGIGYGLGMILYADGSVGHTGTLESTHTMVLNRPDGVTWSVLVNGTYPQSSGDLRGIVDRAFAAGFPAS